MMQPEIFEEEKRLIKWDKNDGQLDENQLNLLVIITPFI